MFYTLELPEKGNIMMLSIFTTFARKGYFFVIFFKINNRERYFCNVNLCDFYCIVVHLILFSDVTT